MEEQITILFLAAGVDDESRKRLEQEAREIRKRLLVGTERDSFNLNTEWAVRASDLQNCLLTSQPHIVHLAGKGTEAGDILLADDNQSPSPVRGHALAELFGILKDNIHVVILSADYADRLASQLVEIIDYAISINGTVDSQNAIVFSTHFYQALSYGRTIVESFNLAINQLKMDGKPESDYEKFVLRASETANPSLSLTGRAVGARQSTGTATMTDAAPT